MFSPARRTIHSSSLRETGPYGGGDSAHMGSAPFCMKFEISETPCLYGLRPCAMTMP
ncbi:Uncharacterised protein [Mycobacterium tuberculosis]|nr:Uncharacterised protein [Mycobacterium tuberculosis]